MREILFRGKTPSQDQYFDDGEWVEGFYTCFNGEEHRIYSGYAETDCADYYPDWYNIRPETVGQYTGFTDKNGKKIFEGDILEVDVRETEEAPDDWIYTMSGSFPRKRFTDRKIKALWSVEYKEHRCQGNGFCVYGKDRRFHTTLTQSTILNVNPVVVGNIYDNPELMKGGEQK